jgi:hypothetical protein
MWRRRSGGGWPERHLKKIFRWMYILAKCLLVGRILPESIPGKGFAMGNLVRRVAPESKEIVGPDNPLARLHRGVGIFLESRLSLGVEPTLQLSWVIVPSYWRAGFTLMVFRSSSGFSPEKYPDDLNGHGQLIIETSRDAASFAAVKIFGWISAIVTVAGTVSAVRPTVSGWWNSEASPPAFNAPPVMATVSQRQYTPPAIATTPQVRPTPTTGPRQSSRQQLKERCFSAVEASYMK